MKFELTDVEVEVLSDILNETHTKTDDFTFEIRQRLRNKLNAFMVDCFTAREIANE